MVRLLVLFLLSFSLAEGKVFKRCDWAKLLQSHGMDQFQKISLADWVCLSRWESSFNTSAINHNHNNSTDYGIFQINSKWWCKDGGVSKSNGCKILCDDLLSDDPTIAIKCAKTVAKQQGVEAWVAWRLRCKGKDLSPYTANCGLHLPQSSAWLL